MAKITIYGTPASRTVRILWMAKEIGLDYDNIPTDFRKGETQTEEYGRINPNRKIPSVVDGDLSLWESFSINLYLAKKYGGDLGPKDLDEDALMTQWSMWGLWEVEPAANKMLFHAVLLPEAERKRAEWQAASDALAQPMAVLDRHLAGRDWIVGGRFTVADVNVAGACNALVRSGYDFSGCPNAKAWLDRCMARPASAESRELAAAAMAH